jgi:hypothetical protein
MNEQTGSENPVEQIPDQEKLIRLRRILDARFDEEELRTLCFDLHIDYDDLEGRSQASKARELVEYLERRSRISELVELVERRRPSVIWNDIPMEALGTKPQEVSPSRDAKEPQSVLRKLRGLSPLVKICGAIGSLLLLIFAALSVPMISDLIRERIEQPNIDRFRILIDGKKAGGDRSIGGESVTLPQLSTLSGGKPVQLEIVVVDDKGTVYSGDEVIKCKWMVAPIENENAGIRTESCKTLYIPNQKYSSQSVAVEVRGRKEQFNPVPPITMEFEVR